MRRPRLNAPRRCSAHRASATVGCSNGLPRHQLRRRSGRQLECEPQVLGAQQRQPRSGAWPQRHLRVGRARDRRRRWRGAPSVAPAPDRHQAHPPSATRQHERPVRMPHSCSAIRRRAPLMQRPTAPPRPPRRRALLAAEARRQSSTHPWHRAHGGGCGAHVARSPAPRHHYAR